MFQIRNFSGLCTSNSFRSTSSSTDNRFSSHRIAGGLSGSALPWLPETQEIEGWTSFAVRGPTPMHERNPCRRNPSCSFHSFAWAVGHVSMSNHSASVSDAQTLCFSFYLQSIRQTVHLRLRQRIRWISGELHRLLHAYRPAANESGLRSSIQSSSIDLWWKSQRKLYL